MVGPLLFLAASVSPSPAPAQPAAGQPAVTAPLKATAHATATIRIVSAVRFGPSYAASAADPAGADRRSALLSDADGTVRPAELLEFQ